jgi:hypothetical protein
MAELGPDINLSKQDVRDTRGRRASITEPSGPVTLIVLVTGVGLRPSTSKPAMDCIDCVPARFTKTISLGQPAQHRITCVNHGSAGFV